MGGSLVFLLMVRPAPGSALFPSAVLGRNGVRAGADRGRSVGHRAGGRAATARQRAARAAEGAGAAAAETDGAGGGTLGAHVGVSDGGGAGRRLPDDDGYRAAANAGAGGVFFDDTPPAGIGALSVGGAPPVGGRNGVCAGADRGRSVGH